MKNQKGITMVSLIIYIIVLFIVIGMLGVIRNNFQSGLKESNDNAAVEAEFNKFNLYFLEDTRTPGNTAIISEEEKIEFKKTGHIYEFKPDNEAIYLYEKSGDKIKTEILLLEEVNKCTFSSSETDKAKKTIKIEIEFLRKLGNTITKEYAVLDEESAGQYQDAEEFVNIKNNNV